MYESSYSASGFWDKLGSMSRQTGCTVIKKAITLYVILTECDTPPVVKASIVAALGYFICPFDLIPDFLPGGFIDDITVMSAVLAGLDVFVDSDDVQARITDYMPEICL